MNLPPSRAADREVVSGASDRYAAVDERDVVDSRNEAESIGGHDSSIYRVIDEYCLFYLRWIEGAARSSLGAGGAKYWLTRVNTPAYDAWAGYAFEGICLKHAAQIEADLGIETMANEIGHRQRGDLGRPPGVIRASRD